MTDKYLRQIELLGNEGQERLQDAKVLVVGSGGLGSPALTSIAVSGVGTLGVVDFDTVDHSNLNRQTIHEERFVDELKTESAKQRLESLNSDLVVKTYPEKITDASASSIFPEYDLIIDCVDNYETRSVVSKVATSLHKVVIEGGIEEFSGFVQIVSPGETACFNCLGLGEAEIKKQVLGAATGVVGSIQALECIKVLTGKWSGEYSYIGVNLMTYEFNTLLLKNNKNCLCTT